MKKMILMVVLLLGVNNAFSTCDDKSLSKELLFDQCLSEAEKGNVEAQKTVAHMYGEGDGVEKNINQAMVWFTKAAENGDSQAQYGLGNVYRRGLLGIPKDEMKSKKWFLKASDGYLKSASSGDPEAQNRLGVMYVTGKGVMRDKREGFKWFKRAAIQGHYDSQRRMYRFYYFGLDPVTQDLKEAFNWLHKVAEHGEADSQRKLGFMYAFGEGTAQNHKEAMKWFRKAAEQEDLEAISAIAKMYRDGFGVPQDDDEAETWARKAEKLGDRVTTEGFGANYYYHIGLNYSLFESTKDGAFEPYLKSAEYGSPYSAYLVGRAYYEGDGVKQSYSGARRWLKKSLQRGEVRGIDLLARMYIEGKGGLKDLEEAFNLYHDEAVDNDNALAQYYVASMYADGQGVVQDIKKAFKWFKLSAEQGDPDAQYAVGLNYHEGKGILQDYKEAVKWFRLASDQNHKYAQYSLGNRYLLGEGVKKSNIQAHMWFNISGANGNQSGGETRDEVAKKMTPEQVEKAQRLAKEWMAKHP